MPAQTQNIQDYLKNFDNMYEAAMVIAKRARQINEDLFQKKRDREILEELEGGYEEDLLGNEEIEEETETAPEVEENPIVTARIEFVKKKIHYHYGK